MNKKLYLGVDVGTYETKGVLVDAKGIVYSQKSIKHEMTIPKPVSYTHLTLPTIYSV